VDGKVKKNEKGAEEGGEGRRSKSWDEAVEGLDQKIKRHNWFW
jgi:hypothetical protein